MTAGADRRNAITEFKNKIVENEQLRLKKKYFKKFKKESQPSFTIIDLDLSNYK